MSETAYLVEARGETRTLDAYVVGAVFAADLAGFALGDGTIRLATLHGEWRTAPAHDGACLTLAADAQPGFLTGGDDGRLVATAPDGTTTQIAAFGAMKWVEHVAAHPTGLRAAAVGKRLHLFDRDHRTFDHATSIGGLAFDARGKRLAASHYNAVSLRFVAAKEDTPRLLDWKGAHQAVAFSPDGTHVVTAMQENALHGWRLADGQHMRMSGYPAKTRFLSFTGKSRWLATSGADALVVWPFFGGGPMGKTPNELAGGDGVICTAVACHPEQEIVAAGFADGLLVLAEIGSGRVIPVAPPGTGGVSALAWNAAGTLLAYGTEGGTAGIVDLAKR